MKELRINRKVSFVERPPFPENMLIELTNACNHKCVFCGYKDMTRHKCFSDKDFTLNIIKQAYDEGVREIGFYAIGEPFLSKDLEEYVAYAKQQGFSYIYLTTNGSLATLERMKVLIENGLDSIKFSVNAASKEIYEKVHGKDDFDNVVTNIIQLRDYVDKNNIDFNMFLSFVQCKLNEQQIPQIYDIFESLVDKIYIFEMHNVGGTLTVGDNSHDQLGEYGLVKIPCNYVFNCLHITAEGYLDACCSDYEGKLGIADLHNTSLKDAWYSDAFIQLRKKHLNKQLKGTLCYNCATHSNEPCFPINNDVVFPGQNYVYN